MGTYGGDRYELLRQFRERARYNVLLSSEIGSEGNDLQFASIVINYDMPWNPMRIEQRIGRVDRIGQRKDKILVLNLIYRDTIGEDINGRLHRGLQIFERALGMNEIILGQEVRELEARLLDPSLTRSQRQQIIDQSALAIENRRLEEEKLEREAAGLIAHGDFVLKRIRESRERGGWIGEEDIRDYVTEALPRLFPGSRVEAEAPGSDLYRIELDAAASTALREFLRRQGRFQPTGLLDGDGRRRYRFTPRVTRREGRIENISLHHPLVRLLLEAERERGSASERHAVAVRLSNFGEWPSPGLYVLASRRVRIGAGPGRVASARILWSGAVVATGERLDPRDAERLARSAAARGRPMPNITALRDFEQAADVLGKLVLSELDRATTLFI